MKIISIADKKTGNDPKTGIQNLEAVNSGLLTRIQGIGSYFGVKTADSYKAAIEATNPPEIPKYDGNDRMKWPFINLAMVIFSVCIVFALAVLCDWLVSLAKGSPMVLFYDLAGNFYGFSSDFLVDVAFIAFLILAAMWLKQQCPKLFRFFSLWNAARKERKQLKEGFWSVKPEDVVATLKRYEEYKAGQDEIYNEMIKKEALSHVEQLQRCIPKNKETYLTLVLQQIKRDIESGALDTSRY